MLLKCQNFWKVGAADEEIFQESPLHEELQLLRIMKNTIHQRIRESVQISREMIHILTELMEESKENNHEN